MHDLIVYQAASGTFYNRLADVTSLSCEKFCETSGARYVRDRHVRRGYFPWQATFNRIEYLKQLLDDGFDGWLIYVDADAYIRDTSFNIRGYLNERGQYALIASRGGFSGKWDINIGVFLFNLGHPRGKELVRIWYDEFHSSVPDELLWRTPRPWGHLEDGSDFPDDQALLQGILRDRAELAEALLQEDTSFLNYETGSFIRQSLRVHGTSQQRLSTVRSEVAVVLGVTQDALDAQVYPRLGPRRVDLTTGVISEPESLLDKTQVYQALFEQLRYRVFNLLALSVIRGSSRAGGRLEKSLDEATQLASWRRYFPEATMIGAHPVDPSHRLGHSLGLPAVDLSYSEHMIRLASALPPLGLVVDDASQDAYFQQTAFLHLFPLVSSGGYYVIEDLGAAPPTEERLDRIIPKTSEMVEFFLETRQLSLNVVPQDQSGRICDLISDVFVVRDKDSTDVDGAMKSVVFRKK